jgi:hypothetical protein
MIMHRHVSSFTLALVTLAWSLAPAAAHAASFRFDATSYTVDLGSEVNLDVLFERTSSEPPVAGFEVGVLLDTSRLSVVSVTPGRALGVPDETALFDVVGSQVAGISLLDAADLESQPLVVRLFTIRLRGTTLGPSYLAVFGSVVDPAAEMTYPRGIFLPTGITVEPASPDVPEPATGLLAVLGVVSLCARRMRRT